MPLIRICRNFALLLPLLALAGCTSMQSTDRPDWEERRQKLLAVDQWELRGRIAVKSNSEGGQARLLWNQDGETSRMRLSGPFGAGAYEVTWQKDSVLVSDASGERRLSYSGDDAADRFLQEQLGWSFPAASTRYWILAMLDPAENGLEQFDDAGMLAALEQHGWRVNFERYGNYSGYQLPTRLSMVNGDARVKIIVSGWDVATLSP